MRSSSGECLASRFGDERMETTVSSDEEVGAGTSVSTVYGRASTTVKRPRQRRDLQSESDEGLLPVAYPDAQPAPLMYFSRINQDLLVTICVMQNSNRSSFPQLEGNSASSSSRHQLQAASPMSEDSASLDFSSILATLARRKWIVLVTCLLVAGSVAGYTHTLPSIYRASSMVRIDLRSEGTMTVTTTPAVQPTRDLTAEVGVLRNSNELARRVVKALRPRDDTAGGPQPFPVFADSGAKEPTSKRAAIRRLRRKVTFKPRQDRNMIEIIATSESPKEASTIANTYAREYKEFSQEKARASVSAARKFLGKQAKKKRRKIQRLERKWESLNNQLAVRGSDSLTSEYNELKSRRDQLTFKLERKRTQLKLLRKQLRKLQPQLEESVLKNQKASGLRSEIQALEKQIAKMRAEAAKYYAINPNLKGDTTRIRNDFPELANLIQRIDALENRKQDLARELVAKATTGPLSSGADGAPLGRVAKLRRRIAEKELAVNQLQSQIAEMDSQIAEYKSRLDNIPEQQLRRKQVKRKLRQAESFYKTITSELQRKAVAEESELGYVEIVQSAFVPGVPVRPNMVQNVILGILLGLGFGVGLAFLREATSTEFRHPEEIEEEGYTLLGVVPAMDSEIERAFNGRDFITVEGREVSTRLMPVLNPWSSVTENYRLIQTNLRHADNENPEVVFVTSAQQGEGKTTTAVNLALTGALSGQRVLLIDADMRNPTAHTVLGEPRTPGLGEILSMGPGSSGRGRDALLDTTSKENGETGDSYMHRPLVEGLYFIPAGTAKEAPTTTLDSERMRCFVEAAQPHFDLIYIDTPPARAVSDAVVMGAQADATALVVSANEADRKALDSVITSLRSVDAHVSGVVFNRFDEQKASGANGAYSYYGSEDYYDYQSKDRVMPEET